MKERELRILRAIANELRAFREEIHAVYEYQRTRDDTQDSQPVRPLRVEITATPQLDPTRREYYEAENRERHSRWNKFKPWVETVGVSVALGIGIVNLLTLWQVKRQADIYQGQLEVMRRQMKLEGRAWVVVKYSTIPLNDGKPIAVPLTQENIGKTIAKHFSGKIAVYVLKAGEDPDLNYSPGHTHYEFGPTGIFLPNTPDVMNWIAIREGQQIVLTPTTHKAILEGKALIAIHGRIEYQDIFGDPHWLTFCQETGGNGTMRVSASDKCAAYNDTDDQDKAKQ